jgi:hypothetical protein
MFEAIIVFSVVIMICKRCAFVNANCQEATLMQVSFLVSFVTIVGFATVFYLCALHVAKDWRDYKPETTAQTSLR